MRRSIKLATSSSKNRLTEVFQERLEDILYNAGYDIKCTGSFPNIHIQAECRLSDKAMMPKLKLVINEFEDNMFDVIPTLTFPTLTASDNDYSDSIHYWLSEWENVGKYMTRLNKFEFNLESEMED